jgi:hypothetical protein
MARPSPAPRAAAFQTRVFESVVLPMSRFLL